MLGNFRNQEFIEAILKLADWSSCMVGMWLSGDVDKDAVSFMTEYRESFVVGYADGFSQFERKSEQLDRLFDGLLEAQGDFLVPVVNRFYKNGELYKLRAGGYTIGMTVGSIMRELTYQGSASNFRVELLKIQSWSLYTGVDYVSAAFVGSSLHAKTSPALQRDIFRKALGAGILCVERKDSELDALFKTGGAQLDGYTVFATGYAVGHIIGSALVALDLCPTPVEAPHRRSLRDMMQERLDAAEAATTSQPD